MAGVQNSYETVFVLSMKLGDEAIAAQVNKFKDLISANGTIESVDEWGKRKLAYPIAKQFEGYYTLINFKSDAEFTRELDRVYTITEGLLRSLIIKKDEKKEIAAKKKADKRAAKISAARAERNEAAKKAEAEKAAAEAAEAAENE